MSNWEQVYRAARGEARRKHVRYWVSGQRWNYGGRTGWHYTAIPAAFRGAGWRRG